MKPVLIFDNDDDFYEAEDMGVPHSRLCRDAYNIGPELFECWGDLRRNDAIIITDSECPFAMKQAQLAAAFLEDTFAKVRVLPLSGGLVGWIKGGGDAASL